MQFLQNSITFILNFVTYDKLNVNLGKTYAKLRIPFKIICKSGGPQVDIYTCMMQTASMALL